MVSAGESVSEENKLVLPKLLVAKRVTGVKEEERTGPRDKKVTIPPAFLRIDCKIIVCCNVKGRRKERYQTV